VIETFPPKDRMHVIYGLNGYLFEYMVVFDADLIDGVAREQGYEWHKWQPIALVWGVRGTLPRHRRNTARKGHIRAVGFPKPVSPLIFQLVASTRS